jgi:hypothetical protein
MQVGLTQGFVLRWGNKLRHMMGFINDVHNKNLNGLVFPEEREWLAFS